MGRLAPDEHPRLLGLGSELHVHVLDADVRGLGRSNQCCGERVTLLDAEHIIAVGHRDGRRRQGHVPLRRLRRQLLEPPRLQRPTRAEHGDVGVGGGRVQGRAARAPLRPPALRDSRLSLRVRRLEFARAVRRPPGETNKPSMLSCFFCCCCEHALFCCT